MTNLQELIDYCPDYADEIRAMSEAQRVEVSLAQENADLERDRAGWDNTTDEAHQSVVNAYVGGYINSIFT